MPNETILGHNHVRASEERKINTEIPQLYTPYVLRAKSNVYPQKASSGSSIQVMTAPEPPNAPELQLLPRGETADRGRSACREETNRPK